VKRNKKGKENAILCRKNLIIFHWNPLHCLSLSGKMITEWRKVVESATKGKQRGGIGPKGRGHSEYV
jgi:hypothetical protein